MKIPKDMGRGKFKIQSEEKVDRDSRYVLYALDKDSDIALDVKSDKSRFKSDRCL